MKKFTFTFVPLFLLPLVLAGEIHAVKASHRPWMSRQRESRVTAAEPARPRLSSKSKKSVRVQSGAKGDRIAQQAIRYKGVKYRFGGDSKSKGFDCSGLVRRVYNDLNMKKLPHTSGSMYQMGKPVRLNELQPGDLVFFKNTYKRGVSHVGVYAGDNRFVHAQNRRRGVITTSLADPYYQLHYAGARRLH